MYEFPEENWVIAHKLAIELVAKKVDVNEVGKVIAYLRVAREVTIEKFFRYLHILVREGNRVGHSSKTAGDYSNIEQLCKEQFKNLSISPQTLLEILGWTVRLMRFYKDIPEDRRRYEMPKPQNTVKTNSIYQVGEIVEATVTKIDGNKITFELVLDEIGTNKKLTEKMPKLVKEKLLHEGQTLRVRITALHPETQEVKKFEPILR
ncbi:MAG: hypothetical protein ACK421_08645 [Pseudanabaenaceae cyanobacterium]